MDDPSSIISFAPFLAASAPTEISHHWDMGTGEMIWKSFLIIFLVLLNGFFVAAEFSIVKVRGSQLDALVETGRRGAKLSKHVTEHMDRYLSATQLGITLASLGLGWVGEKFIAAMLHPLFFLGGQELVPEYWVGKISFVIAFSIITVLHIVLGELMPKSLAIRRSLSTAMATARPLTFFYYLFKPAIAVLNGFANWLLKVLFKIEPVGEHGHMHSAEELRLLLEQTEQSEEVTDTERAILINALELNDRLARDVLTSRQDVVTLNVNATFSENVKVALDSRHTRFPLVDGHLDEPLGLIHIKDLTRVLGDESPDLNSIKRRLVSVPELMHLDDLLILFRRERVHMALVLDERGGSQGIVTLDNVIEELVGDIQDEFDKPEDEREFFPLNDNEFVTLGTMPLHDLAEQTSLEFENPDVSTVGGYVTHLLGHLPIRGETVEVENYIATVVETDGKSVGKLRFVRQRIPEELVDEDTGS